MFQVPLSVTIIACNEEKNIGRAIRSVREWAAEVIVVDSGSTDRTTEIAESLGARVYHNPWPGYGRQKNHAQGKTSSNWVLNLDADEEVPPELATEIREVLMEAESRGITGFYLPRKTWYLGRWILHGGWYPNHLLRLADKRHARWTEPHLHEALETDGPTARLTHPLHHFTFDDISDQVRTNLNYAAEGAKDLEARGRRFSVTRMLLKPTGKFLETYILKRGFLDGLAGLIISVNAAHSMFLKHAFLYRPEGTPEPRK